MKSFKYFFSVFSLQNASLHHPKALTLGLIGEKLVDLSACYEKATLVAESGKV